ncbi:Alpha/Beta hydrolase protein [Schizophyllum fasciatum]
MTLPLLPDALILKEHTTSRGIKYAYRHAPPAAAGRPTLLLLHGFPSTAHDWRHQAAHFAARGLGVLVPDVLGYGGTGKPAEPAAYAGARQARDLVEILDAEGVEGVVVVGHDWGTMPTSYLAVLYQERFLGFVHLSVGLTLARGITLEPLLAFMKQNVGSEIFGYWGFFNKDEAAGIIEKNLDSLFDLVFPKDPELWKTYLNPLGGVDPLIAAGRRFETADFVSEEDRKIFVQEFLKHGLTGPLNWYKLAARGLQTSDGLDLSIDNVKITKPYLYIGGAKDYVCRPELQDRDMKKACADYQIEVLDAGHWLQLELPGRVNEIIEGWLGAKGLV